MYFIPNLDDSPEHVEGKNFMKKILIFTTSEGHLSIGQALETKISARNLPVKLVFLEEPGLKVYKFIYRYSPALFTWIFKISGSKGIVIFIEALLMLENYQRVKNEIKEFPPTHVFNTSFGFSPILSQMIDSFDFQFINILPNPRTFFYQDLAEKADVNGVFDQQSVADAQKRNPRAKTKVSGWFIRPDFQPAEPSLLKNLRQEFDLSRDPTVLIVSGSEGMFEIVDTVKEIVKQTFHGLQVIVACGHNQELKKQLDSLPVPDMHRVLALGFTNRLHDYMKVADLVVGKAGPNSIFEAVACHKPFLATSNVGGLEEGNLQIIQEYDIGWVEKDPTEAKKLILKVLQNPQLFQEKATNAKKLAEYIELQSERFLDQVLS